MGRFVMADTKGKKKRKLKDAKAVEVHPNAWDRFTKAVKRIVPGKPANKSYKNKNRAS